MPSGFFVCVESCPTTNNFNEFICEYEVQHDIDETLKAAAEISGGAVTDSNSTMSLYLFHTGQKQCMPQIESTSFLGYCIPSKPLEDVLLTSTSTSFSDASKSSNTTVIEANKNTTSNNETATNGTAVRVSASAKKKASSDVFDLVMSDVHTVRYVMFAFGCGAAMILGIVFLIIIQLPGLLSVLVWSMITAVDVAFVVAGYYTKGISARWEASGRPGNEATALFYGSYVLCGLAALWFVAILFLRKRILLAIACVKEASRAISTMPIMTIFPVLQVLCLVAFTVVWGIFMAHLASSGEIGTSCMCPKLQGFTSFNDNELSPTLSPTVTDMSPSSLVNGTATCDDGCFLYKELTYSTNTKYAGLYMVFVWFWTSQFIVAVGQIVVALSVSLWYFSRDKGKVGNSTFIKSVGLVFFYHLGTVAFGKSWQSLPARCMQFITNNYPLVSPQVV
jgi:hypothetical protein